MVIMINKIPADHRLFQCLARARGISPPFERLDSAETMKSGELAPTTSGPRSSQRHHSRLQLVHCRTRKVQTVETAKQYLDAGLHRYLHSYG